MRLLCAALTFWFALAPAALGRESAGRYDAAGADQKGKGSHQNDYLIFGTVFTEKGLSFPGAAIRVRRAGEKKVAGEATSDRRGEFAVRVAQGVEYEITVSAKGFQDETRKVDAKYGDRQDLVFRLKPAVGGRTK